MQIINDLRLQRKIAKVVFLTGLLTNTAAVINNMIHIGIFANMTIISFLCALSMGIAGYIIYKKRKYITCIKFIYCVVGFIEIPMSCVLAGFSDVIYFLCVVGLINVVTKGKRRFLHLGAICLIVVICFFVRLYMLWDDKKMAALFIREGSQIGIAAILTIIAVFMITRHIIEALQEAGRQNYVASVIYDNLKYIIILNLDDGHFEYLREEDERESFMESRNYDVVNSKAVKTSVVHPNDIEIFKKFTDRQNLRQLIEEKERYTSEPVRMNFSGKYEWYEFEFAQFPGYSDDDPYCINYLKRVDSMDSDSEDAIRLVEESFYKILRINLTDDTYKVVKCTEDEVQAERGFDSRSISTWITNFANTGQVHEDDQAGYIEFANVERMRRSFAESSEGQNYKYRRLTDGKWMWVNMELRKSVDYTSDYEIIMLYIRDINDEYTSELVRTKMLEYQSNNDALTGVYNRHKYYEICSRISEMKDVPVGVLFCDLNGLKVVNDTKGHDAGDKLINSFAKSMKDFFGVEKCYRLSGDEFLVIWEQCQEEEFLSNAEAFREKIEEDENFMASIGYTYECCTEDVERLVAKAEKEMYKHKQKYYDTHPEADRRR